MALAPKIKIGEREVEVPIPRAGVMRKHRDSLKQMRLGTLDPEDVVPLMQEIVFDTFDLHGVDKVTLEDLDSLSGPQLLRIWKLASDRGAEEVPASAGEL